MPTNDNASNTTAKAPKKIPGANGFKYKPQWGVIVICEGEERQRQIYESLRLLGLREKLKVVCV